MTLNLLEKLTAPFLKVTTLTCILQFVALLLSLPVLAETVNFNLLQVNDIYEITPIAGGTRGGLARVATVREQLLKENPQTYTILAGDAFSPSALGTAKVNGKMLAGQQMVAVMNAVGFDYATFGNHEFDLSESSFLERIKESKFTWFSGNVFDKNGQLFSGVYPSVILSLKGEQGGVIRVGLVGVTIPSNPAKYVKYKDPIATIREQVKALKDQVDVIIAVTHLSIQDDYIIAETIPEIKLILGGHEHENIQQWRGQFFTPIFKADANARTVYIHRLSYDTEQKKLTINSQIQPITDRIPDEPKTAKVVQEWVDKGFAAFRASGFYPEAEIGATKIALDGLEVSVRNHPTTLTQLIAKAILQEGKEADLAIFNGGAIRIDDVIPPGKITQYDVIRILPFGGKIVVVEMKGDLLERVLNQGQANKGRGGYLQMENVEKDSGNRWLVKGKPLNSSQIYKIVTSDFLVSGKEQNLEFLNLENSGVKLLEEKRDIRQVVIDYIQNQGF